MKEEKILMKKKHLKKRSKSKATIDKADRALQDWYRTTYPDKKCEVCGRPFQLMHHFVPKSQSNYLRFNPINLIFLCHSCHFRHHNTGDPIIHGKIIELRGLDWFKNISKEKRKLLSSYTKKQLYHIMERYEVERMCDLPKKV